MWAAQQVAVTHLPTCTYSLKTVTLCVFSEGEMCVAAAQTAKQKQQILFVSCTKFSQNWPNVNRWETFFCSRQEQDKKNQNSQMARLPQKIPYHNNLVFAETANDQCRLSKRPVVNKINGNSACQWLGNKARTAWGLG